MKFADWRFESNTASQGRDIYQLSSRVAFVGRPLETPPLVERWAVGGDLALLPEMARRVVVRGAVTSGAFFGFLANDC